MDFETLIIDLVAAFLVAIPFGLILVAFWPAGKLFFSKEINFVPGPLDEGYEMVDRTGRYGQGWWSQVHRSRRRRNEP